MRGIEKIYNVFGLKIEGKASVTEEKFYKISPDVCVFLGEASTNMTF